ncbi:hypothetical protein ACFC58_10245 [Kitasatospora purpeofusca]|uniref:hypothetical protein n=1 Tax=Kitasatospora purpeofusca TaxID=67352 RepID=UPI0035DB2A30
MAIMIRRLWNMEASADSVEARFATDFIGIHDDRYYAQDCWEHAVLLNEDDPCPDDPMQQECCEAEAKAILAAILEARKVCPWCEVLKSGRSVKNVGRHR